MSKYILTESISKNLIIENKYSRKRGGILIIIDQEMPYLDERTDYSEKKRIEA